VNLLTVTHYFESHRGGIEIVAGQIVREIASLGHDVVWVASDASPPPMLSGCRLVPVRAINTAEARLGVPFPVPTIGAIRRIWREVRESDAVLLHDGLYMTTVAAFMAARLRRKPVVMVQHVGEVPYRSAVLRLLMRIGNGVVARPLLARADRVVFISEITARHFAGVRFRASPELIFNGVDTATFRPVADAGGKADIRRRLGLPVDRPVLLFVGRFVEKKGLHALERMARRRPDVEWAFAGWGPLDPGRWRLPNVRVFSELSGRSLAPLYQAADAFVLPSTGEGFPLVVQEALACGLPVVCGADTASADEGAAPLLRGVPVHQDEPERTAEAFCAELDRLLADLPGERARAQERFRFAGERYAWSAAARRYVALLQSLLPAASATADMPAPREPAK
jgi:glycosyltransferase involved in cell wall biosynthesis